MVSSESFLRLKSSSQSGPQSPGARGSTSKFMHMVAGGCSPSWLWLEVSVPHHVGLYRGCLSILTARQLASPKASNQRERERAPKTEDAVIYILISEVTSHHFCCIVLVRQTNCGSVEGRHKQVGMPEGNDPWDPQ